MARDDGWLLRGGTLVTLDGERRVLRGDLLITAGRIAALGEVAPDQVPPGTPVRDVTGCLVMPGLVQAHVHLCQTLCRGHADDLALLAWLRERLFPYEAALDAEDVALAAALGSAELLLGGTTALLDMGTVHHQDALCQTVARSGLRATVGKAMMDLTDSAPPSLCESTAASLAESDALCQRWHGQADGRLRYAYAPRFILSCSDELLRAVAARVEHAADDGPRLHTHAAEQPDEVALVQRRYGCGNIAALQALGLSGPAAVLAHCVHLQEDEPLLLARSGAHVAHCPSSNLKLGSGIAQVVELRQHGVNVALGADGAPCNNRLDGFMELRLLALLQQGRRGPGALPALQALEIATLGGARALGLADHIGTLAVGKRADVIVLRQQGLHAQPPQPPPSFIVYAASASDVRDVLVDGRLLVRDGELTPATGLDIERLRALAAERTPPLLRRAGLA